ncbi:hypothetical protein FHR72_001172 [Mycolicibacterium iranicum]|uniref:Asp23/Gls24 family envelope stress response protein n=1 Tax=Mycolicibacterium iranicum TaxID=912594 RepID=A0A839Q1L7_MYCIR|nr:hypothetical protein [Mycolicibacterium iranicum]MBB2989709.1 hypothetical protein [Mycolicibacterium iranicum]
MTENDNDVTNRAACVLQAQPEPGWFQIRDAVIDAVRSTLRGGRPILVEDPRPGTDAGILRVSGLVLGALLSRALAEDPDYAVTDIELTVDDDRLHGISIDLSARYLAEFSPVVNRVRARCHAVVADAIGASTDVPIHLHVSDVH